MKYLAATLKAILYGVLALGAMLLITNGSFNCSKGFWAHSPYTCSATVVIPNR